MTDPQKTCLERAACNARRSTRLHYIVYGAYALFGILVAFTEEIPVPAIEVNLTYTRIARLWQTFNPLRVASIPYWWEQVSSIGLFFLAAPFAVLFGPSLAAMRLGMLCWNLLGLRAFEKSFDTPQTGVTAVALAAFGIPLVTELQITPFGGYPMMLLPFGILCFLASRFLRSSASITAWAALGYGIAAVAFVVWMPGLVVTVIGTSLVLLWSLSYGERRRLLPWLVRGSVAGLIACLPFVLQQDCLTGKTVFRFDRIDRDLQRLLLSDLPSFLRIRGIPGSGYLLFASFLAIAFVSGRRIRASRGTLLPVFWVTALLVPIWLAVNSHHQPDVAATDWLRLRHFTLFWPAWAGLIAIVASRTFPAKEEIRRLAAAASWVLVLAGVITSFGWINYCRVGITAHIPLENRLGRMIDDALPPCVRPHSFEFATNAPPEHRGTVALVLGFDTVFRASLHETAPSALRRVLPEDSLRETYLTGLGLFACEGSLQNAAETEQALEDWGGRLPEEERETLRKGCSLGKRWRDNALYFQQIAPPPDDFAVPTPTCAAWDPPSRHRVQPIHRIWPSSVIKS